MNRNEIMCFLMNEHNFKYLGNEFSDGNMCNHLVNFDFGEDYVIGMYVYSTAATMVQLRLKNWNANPGKK